MKVAQIWTFVHDKGDKERGPARKVSFVHFAKKFLERKRKEKERKKKIKEKPRNQRKEKEREKGRAEAGSKREKKRSVLAKEKKEESHLSHHGPP